MAINDILEDDVTPQWQRPTLSAFNVSEITLLGKLGSLFDAITSDNSFSED